MSPATSEQQACGGQRRQDQEARSSIGRGAKLRRASSIHGDLIGAIDQGTSSTRFLVFENGTGRLVASSQTEIKRITPQEGWVEIDPIAIMASVYATIANVYEQLGGDACGPTNSLLKCIGICNQRESTVVWDAKTGEPLYNVIVWMDNRTKDIVDNMIDSIPGRDFNRLKDKTGLPMSTYFSAFKLRWLFENVPAVKEAQREQRLLFGTVDTWILWNLTGNHLTDVTNASRTFLMDIESLEWDKSLCKTFKVPMQILPKILSSADDFGELQFGPFKGTPVTGVIGDQSAALFGHNCLQLGQTKATFGTGCFIMQNIGPGPLNGALRGVQREAKRGLITTVGYKLRDKPVCYALEGSIKIAGAALTWLRDNMQLIANYEECDLLVNKTTNSAGVFFVPALGGLYSPYWDPNAAGLFIGLSQFTRREHLVRATFDSVAFQTNDILSLMRGVTAGLMIDGGLCKSDNLCQILADVTGCDIVRPSMCETSALGAAMVAGCGASIWSYESMLANSRENQTSCATASFPTLIGSGTNGNLFNQQHHHLPNNHHHYPPESLHHSTMAANATSALNNRVKEQQARHKRFRHRNASSDIGVNDDAGGGGGGGGEPGTPPPTSAQPQHGDEHQKGRTRTAAAAAVAHSRRESDGYEVDDEEEEPETRTGGGHQNAPNSAANTDSEEVGATETQVVVENCPTSRQANFYPIEAAPSSGYNSGDNFESTNSSGANSSLGQAARNRLGQSPTPSTSQATDTAANGRDSVATSADLNQLTVHNQNSCRHELPFEHDEEHQIESYNQRHYLVSANQTDVVAAAAAVAAKVQHSFEEAEEEVHEFGGRDSFGEDGYDSPTTSFASDDAYDEAGDDDDDFEYDNDDESYTQQVSPSLNGGDAHRSRRASVLVGKPTDVFQSYISLEHRADLVNTWRLAVERSMQWTKIHHEEVRRIDYMRLSSLPISMYVFFSVGIVALSSLFPVAPV